MNPPKIKVPAPRRLAVGSWWALGFWFSIAERDRNIFVDFGQHRVARSVSGGYVVADR